MNKIIEQFVAKKFPNMDGEVLKPGVLAKPKEFARDLGVFLYELHRLETTGGTQPSFTNSFRGADLQIFEAEMHDRLQALKHAIPAEEVELLWERVVKFPRKKTPVWVHGNLTLQNLLVNNDKLSGITGFENAVIGDPACDLTIAWALFDEKARKIFFSSVEADSTMIARAQMWAIFEALKNYNSEDIDQAILARDVLFRITEELNLGVEPDMY